MDETCCMSTTYTFARLHELTQETEKSTLLRFGVENDRMAPDHGLATLILGSTQIGGSWHPFTPVH